MFNALSGMVCFVLATVSFMYGTRIAWECGKKCSFKAETADKKQTIFEKTPAAVVVYLFGFLLLFSVVIDGILTIIVSSIISAVLLSGFVISMAMPELKFNMKVK